MRKLTIQQCKKGPLFSMSNKLNTINLVYNQGLITDSLTIVPKLVKYFKDISGNSNHHTQKIWILYALQI